MSSISKNESSNKKLDTKSTKYYIATDNALMNEIQELLIKYIPIISHIT